jgi:hypothetical protein
MHHCVDPSTPLIFVKEMCIPLYLLQSIVRTGVLWYIPAGHRCSYHLTDVDHII